MKKNQNGFTTIELLITFVIIALVAGIGVYVLKENSKRDQTAQSTTGQELTGREKLGTTDAKADSIIKELPFTFTYPKSWSATVAHSESIAADLRLTAPDTMIDEDRTFLVATKGAVIGVYKLPVISSELDTIAEFKSETNPIKDYIQNGADRIIDGVEAFEYDLDFASHIAHNVIFYQGNSAYRIEMPKNVYDKTEYAGTYKDLIQSIDFK